MKGMRALLRDLDTGLFYGVNGAWVKEHSEALNFPSPEHAEEQGLMLGKPNLEIFVTEADGRPIWGRRIEN
jgi:hypothetical protein